MYQKLIHVQGYVQYTQPTLTYTLIQTRFQGTIGAIRGMFGLCYLNKYKIGCITGESWANPAFILAWIHTAHYQMWGGGITSQEHTHLALGLRAHTYARSLK